MKSRGVLHGGLRDAEVAGSLGFCMEINLGVHRALHKEAKQRGAGMQRGEGMQSAGPLGCWMEKNWWMHGMLHAEGAAWRRNIAWIIMGVQ